MKIVIEFTKYLYYMYMGSRQLKRMEKYDMKDEPTLFKLEYDKLMRYKRLRETNEPEWFKRLYNIK